mgnify:CR=1 FL=1
MKVGDLVKSVDRYAHGDHKLGLIMEIMLDGTDPPTNTYFVRWMGDSDWSFLYEEDIEVLNESR